MRDSYVLFLFAMFICAGTFLAYTGKVEPQLIITPIVTGFLGLLASTRPSKYNYHEEFNQQIPASQRNYEVPPKRPSHPEIMGPPTPRTSQPAEGEIK